MTAWMLYSVGVGVCAIAAAFCAEAVARMLRLPARFIWIAAGALTVVLAASAPMRARAAGNSSLPADIASIDMVATGFAAVEQRVPPSAAGYFLGFCVIASLLAMISFGAAYYRMRRSSRAWPEIELHGRRVRLSPDTGPVVIGINHPEIIFPRWALDRSPQEQRMILAHEDSHLKAGDPLLLGVSWLMFVLMPWNPALWIMLSRVRLAMEIDCDSRVLGGGVSTASYGSLLVAVAEKSSPLLAATALASSSSHLRQRILAMQKTSFKHPVLRGITIALIGAAGLLAACEARLPTAESISSMDANSAESGVRSIGLAADSAVTWTINGVAASALEAKKISANDIATVDVVKTGGASRINLRTKDATQEAVPASGVVQPSVRVSDGAIAGQKTLSAKATAPAPLFFIDGVRADASQLKKIDPKRIDGIEVVKGARAVEVYGADGSNGVVLVTLKPASGQ